MKKERKKKERERERERKGSSNFETWKKSNDNFFSVHFYHVLLLLIVSMIPPLSFCCLCFIIIIVIIIIFLYAKVCNVWIARWKGGENVFVCVLTFGFIKSCAACWLAAIVRRQSLPNIDAGPVFHQFYFIFFFSLLRVFPFFPTSLPPLRWCFYFKLIQLGFYWWFMLRLEYVEQWWCLLLLLLLLLLQWWRLLVFVAASQKFQLTVDINFGVFWILSVLARAAKNWLMIGGVMGADSIIHSKCCAGTWRSITPAKGFNFSINIWSICWSLRGGGSIMHPVSNQSALFSLNTRVSPLPPPLLPSPLPSFIQVLMLWIIFGCAECWSTVVTISAERIHVRGRWWNCSSATNGECCHNRKCAAGAICNINYFSPPPCF